MSCAPDACSFALQMTRFDVVVLCHLLVMGGAEVAAALLSNINQCPVCTCPHSEFDQTDVSYPYCNTESFKKEVNAAL